MPSTADQLEELTARLDRHAKAITSLRAQVRDLKAALDAAGASASTIVAAITAIPATAAPGVYVYNPACCMCGQAKEPGRLALTCKACGVIYQAGIKGQAERTTFDACVNCRTSKPADTRMLCSQCSPAFRVWKASR